MNITNSPGLADSPSAATTAGFTDLPRNVAEISNWTPIFAPLYSDEIVVRFEPVSIPSVRISVQRFWASATTNASSLFAKAALVVGSPIVPIYPFFAFGSYVAFSASVAPSASIRFL